MSYFHSVNFLIYFLYTFTPTKRRGKKGPEVFLSKRTRKKENNGFSCLGTIEPEAQCIETADYHLITLPYASAIVSSFVSWLTLNNETRIIYKLSLVLFAYVREKPGKIPSALVYLFMIG